MNYEVIRDKPDAIVLAPFDPSAMLPAVDKLNAAGIPVTNVNERLSGGNTIAYVGTAAWKCRDPGRSGDLAHERSSGESV